jgi:hypothetical protein
MTQEAESFFRQMLLLGLAPDDLDHEQMMRMYEELGDLKNSEIIFFEMRTRGLEPQASHFGILLRARAKIRDKAGVEKIISEMERKKIAADPETLAIVVEMYVTLGRSRAVELFVERAFQNSGNEISATNAVVLISNPQKPLRGSSTQERDRGRRDQAEVLQGRPPQDHADSTQGNSPRRDEGLRSDLPLYHNGEMDEAEPDIEEIESRTADVLQEKGKPGQE